MNVGGNVLHAASKTVVKDKTNDPDAVIKVRRNISFFIYLIDGFV